MSGPIGNAMFAACLTILWPHLVHADVLHRGARSGTVQEEDEEPQETAPRSLLKKPVLPPEPAAAAVESEHQLDHQMSEHAEDHEGLGELTEEHQMDIYNKMKEEFGEDQLEVYAKMQQEKQGQQEEEEPAEPEAEAPAGPTYSTKMRMTLKGYVQERVEDTERGHDPPVENAPEEPSEKVATDNSTVSAGEANKEVATEEDSDEEHLKVFLPGQQAEWNSMIGTEAYKMNARDWQLVNIVDKSVGKNGTTMYNIQRGTMQVRVEAAQLRAPQKAADKHDGVGEDHREVDHADAPQDLDHVVVLVPIAAPVGNRCIGKGKKLGKSYDNIHKSPRECRVYCEEKADCHYASFSKEHGCHMYSKCKKTGGTGYRTWMKLKALPDEAWKARQAELLVDNYEQLGEHWMLSLVEATSLNANSATKADASKAGHDTKAASSDLAMKVGSDDSIVISDVDLRPSQFSAWSTQLIAAVLIFGMVAALYRQRLSARMNMKAMKDGTALDGGIMTWVQKESAAVIGILQRVISGVDIPAELHKEHPKEPKDGYDMEMNYPVPDDDVKIVRGIPTTADTPEELEEDAEPAAVPVPEKDNVTKKGPQGSSQKEADDDKPSQEVEAGDAKPSSSIFKASQGYHEKLLGAKPVSLKDEANASLKSLMSGSFKSKNSKSDP